jgi:hypothetical protein
MRIVGVRSSTGEGVEAQPARSLATPDRLAVDEPDEESPVVPAGGLEGGAGQSDLAARTPTQVGLLVTQQQHSSIGGLRAAGRGSAPQRTRSSSSHLRAVLETASSAGTPPTPSSPWSLGRSGVRTQNVSVTTDERVLTSDPVGRSIPMTTNGAVEYAASRNAPAVEGYPVDLGAGRIDLTMAFVGTRAMFENAGFQVAGSTEAIASKLPRPVMRRMI